MAPDTPPMSELLSRFLTGQADARAAGFSEGPAAEVEPFEAVAFATVEPRAAWAEAVQALAMLDTEASGITVAPPADWAGLVSGAASAIAVPMAAGNFPQLVRDLTALIDSGRAATLPSRSPVSWTSGPPARSANAGFPMSYWRPARCAWPAIGIEPPSCSPRSPRWFPPGGTSPSRTSVPRSLGKAATFKPRGRRGRTWPTALRCASTAVSRPCSPMIRTLPARSLPAPRR